ncbi:L-rhamnose isomerase [Candidatus Sumerlaeota bacterium]|nr:L-rhamnose isomerase [Candidatus Sumerlaeota bacterium]
MHEDAYKILCKKLASKGLDVEGIKQRLKQQRIETPSWGYSDSGTRFKVFKQPGVPRNVFERLEDAAFVHKMTGVAPSVALHIPWDATDDWQALRQFAQELGIEIGAINPNVFQDDCYKLGSFANEDPGVRQRALEHHFECIEIMRLTGSKILSLWYADGTNYPGQGDFRRRKRYFLDCLEQVYTRLKGDERMLIEYKFFEPAFYHTDIADWGIAYSFAIKLGEQAQVLVDLGHHPQGTNIEHIVAFLLDEGKLGGFHFNNRKYADDDLTAGSINPYELFLIYCELVADEKSAKNVVYMIDQSHNIKPKVEAMIQTIMNLQTAYAKALIVDRKTLTEAQKAGDVVTAEQQLISAFNTDVEPLLAQVRTEMGISPDPLSAYKSSGYLEKIISKR